MGGKIPPPPPPPRPRKQCSSSTWDNIFIIWPLWHEVIKQYLIDFTCDFTRASGVHKHTMIELFLFQSICFGAEWFSLINLIDEKSIFFRLYFARSSVNE